MKNFKHILIFGALWGFSEVLLGTMLHIPAFESFSGYILFPVGFYLMLEGYRRTGKLSSFLYCGIIAATLKLSTFFIYPPALMINVLKPAMFIVLESICVIPVVYVLNMGIVFELSNIKFVKEKGV